MSIVRNGNPLATTGDRGHDEDDRPPGALAFFDSLDFSQMSAKHPTLRPYLIDGYARIGETINLVADPKIGKSWLVLYIALCVVTGRLLFGKFHVARGAVMLVDNELHPETLAHRIKIVAKQMGLIDPATPCDQWPKDECYWPEHLHTLCLRGRLTNILELGSFFDDIPNDGYFKLVVLDAKYRFGIPGKSENSNADEMSFYNLVDQYATKVNAGFLLVHHASKGNQGDKSITDVGAGAGAQSRAADCHLIIRQHEQEDCAVLDGVVRTYLKPKPLVIRWKFPLWTIDEDLDPANIKKPASRGDERQSKKDAEGIAVIRKALMKGPKTRRALRQAGLGPDRVNRLLSQMEGEITTDASGVVSLV